MNKYELIGILLVKVGDTPYTYRQFKSFSENGYDISHESYDEADDDGDLFAVIKVEKDDVSTFFKIEGWTNSDGESKMTLGELKEVKPKERIVKEWV